jgi:phage gpG-like protein
MRLVFEVAGDKLIEREILRMGNYAADARPAFAAIGDLFIEQEVEQFESEGRHASAGWKPIKEETLRRKLNHRPPLDPRILHATGALRRSLTEPGDENMVFEARPQELVYGSKLPYASVHQRGGGRVPRRRPIEFTERTKRDAVRILQRWVFTGEVGR